MAEETKNLIWPEELAPPPDTPPGANAGNTVDAETEPKPPKIEFVDHVLDNGGVRPEQVQHWEAKHAENGAVTHVRVPVDYDLLQQFFPDAPPVSEYVPETDALVTRRFFVECWLAPVSIDEAFRIIEKNSTMRERYEYALNALWLGGSPLIEGEDVRVWCKPLRLSVLMTAVPAVADWPAAQLKKSSPSALSAKKQAGELS